MQQHNIKPVAQTFVCLLNACSHAGLVKQACDIFGSMQDKFGVEPDAQHQHCIVDVWGRAGMLDQAEEFIISLQEQDTIIWMTLLGACCNHGDADRAQRAANQVLQREPTNAAAYVLLANTYAAAGRWKEHSLVWNQMKFNNIKKIPGSTWVTVNGKTEVFQVDADHLYRQQILDLLSSTRQKLTEKFDYQPDTSCVLQPNLSEEGKLERLWLHSEKMALAWALLSSSTKEDTIIMHKNLRVCHDCHTSLKLISELYKRKFIIRDANRFHHFANGKCSCNDYW